ncbi:glycosyltransferase family protein 64 protein C5, partial [Tanacetum coccineum]
MLGCHEDSEGSWSIGVFYGDSPFSLKPIESMNVWDNKSASWPVANHYGDVLYLFFETKNSITMQGDIGVARSIDNGASWEQMGVVLDEEWHLSYPYVFDYNGQIYMMPEGSKKGDSSSLYRAVAFPLKWELEKSDQHKKNGELDILDTATSLRPGQDDGETYGKRVRVFKIEVLTPYNYKEVEVDLGFLKPTKGVNAWNGARSHHLDVQLLKSGQWIAVSDGDRTASGTPPDLTEFDSAVPVRIRVEEKNSLNNRFKSDPLIKTRAVLELDDDIMMSCDYIERGFKVWREKPDRLVGFYPRLVTGPGPLEYRGEKHARKFNGYNMILTGAAFMDNQVAFSRYWSDERKRETKQWMTLFNCEDLLIEFIVAKCYFFRAIR